jgi:hypothetical protein
MTPHERAEAICSVYNNSVLHELIAGAIEAHTADLRALLAEQAQRVDALQATLTHNDEAARRNIEHTAEERDAEKSRADEAKATIARMASGLRCSSCGAHINAIEQERDAALAQVERYNEMAGRDADRLAELNSTLDAALARESRLREALEPFAQMTVPRSINATPRLTGADALLVLWLWLRDINHVHHSCGVVYASAIYDCVSSLRAALSTPPGEWLEEQRLEAKMELLEGMSMLTPVVGRLYRLTFQNSKEGEIECEGCPLVVESVCVDAKNNYMAFESQLKDGSVEGYEFFRRDYCVNKNQQWEWWDEYLWTRLVQIEQLPQNDAAERWQGGRG